MLPDLCLLASESAGAALSHTISRVVFGSMLVFGIGCLIGGAFALRRNRVLGVVLLLMGAGAAVFAGLVAGDL